MKLNGYIDRTQWYLDPQLIFLNHGSFGACPRILLKRQSEIRQQMESSPVAFFLRELAPLVEESRQALASFLQIDAEGLVQVGNASEGVSTVLNSIKWNKGDEVILTNHTYLACKHMLEALAQKQGIILRCVDVEWNALNQVDEDGEDLWVSAFTNAYTEYTRLALIDHITSPTGVIVPVQPLIDFFKTHHVLTLIDGAHAPGHIPLNLSQLDADFYTGNAHKWMFAPKECAFLYVAPHHRDQMLPLVVSHGYRMTHSRFHALFDWTGTRDYSAWVVLKDAIHWVNQQGGFDAFMQYNHTLAVQARHDLMNHLWQGNPPKVVSSQQLGALATCPLPPAFVELFGMESTRVGPVEIHPLQEKLYQNGIEIPVIPWMNGQQPQLNVRLSAQVYNTLEEYHILAEKLLQFLHQ